MDNTDQTHRHPHQDNQKLQEKMAAIGKKILVLSGKGGVGKSTVAANLATALAQKGSRVGLLDIDLHGPSIPRMTGLAGQRCVGMGDEIMPLQVREHLKVMSIAFLLQEKSQAVVWRGPMKYSVIQQLLADTAWGELDYLVVDAPPGTGDEPLSIAQMVGVNAGAVLVTTPQEVAVEDVRRCVSFCRQVFLPVWGLIENMSGFVCPHCGEQVELFGRDGGRRLADEMDLDFLGRIPLDPAIVTGADRGEAIENSMASAAVQTSFEQVIEKLLSRFR